MSRLLISDYHNRYRRDGFVNLCVVYVDFRRRFFSYQIASRRRFFGADISAPISGVCVISFTETSATPTCLCLRLPVLFRKVRCPVTGVFDFLSLLCRKMMVAKSVDSLLQWLTAVAKLRHAGNCTASPASLARYRKRSVWLKNPTATGKMRMCGDADVRMFNGKL